MTDDDPRPRPGSKGETYGHAGGYNTDVGQSAGEFGSSEAGAATPEPGGYTGQTGTGYGQTQGGVTEEDAALRESITTRLAEDPFLDATHIEVWVAEGEVTLSGEVTARADKRRAEDLSADASGAKRIHNRLHVHEASAE